MTEKLRDQTARNVAVAPDRSVLVQAPAGSGKTSLLVARYLNLLAIVDRPEEVVALTFTRKAAAEMRERVLASLAGERGADVMRRSDDLGWDLPNHPSRLLILTIDAFAARVAGALPIGASTATRREVTADATSLYEEAVSRLFDRIDRSDPIARSLSEFLDLHDNDYESARRALIPMLAQREVWLAPMRHLLSLEDSVPDSLRELLHDAVGALQAELSARIEHALTARQLTELLDVARYSADRLGLAQHDDTSLLRHAAHLLVTDQGTMRRRFDARLGFPGSDSTAREQRSRIVALADDLAYLRDEFAQLLHAPQEAGTNDEHNALLPIAVTLALAAVELERCFERRRRIDFVELLFGAKRALGASEQPTDLALALDHRISHLLIDELQDTSAAQMEFLERLTAGWTPADGRTLFAVGDPMQSIYLFRDADVSLFQRAARFGIGDIALDPTLLTTNFRSEPELVAWINSTFPTVFGDHDDPERGAMRYVPATSHIPASGRGEVRCIRFASSRGRSTESNYIVQRVQSLRACNHTDSIAVLVRNRSHAAELIAEFDEHGVPWVGRDMDPLANVPIVRDMMSLYSALCDDDRLAWFSLLRSPLVGLARNDLVALAAQEERIGTLLRGGTDHLALSDEGRIRLSRVAPIIADFMAMRELLPNAQWLEALWIRLGGADAYGDPAQIQHGQRLLELIEHEQPYIADPPALEPALARLYAKPPEVAGAVTVATIHGVKGLEFDHVVVAGLDRSSRTDTKPLVMWHAWKHYLLIGSRRYADRGGVHHWLWRQQRAREDNERARLLYVAVTRAKTSLLLTAEQEGEKFSPSSLASMLPPGTFAQVAATPTPHPPSRVREQLRLPANYVWQPPVDMPAVTSTVAVESIDHASSTAHSREVAIGTIMHRTIAALTHRLPSDVDRYLAERRRIVSRGLLECGVDPNDLASATNEVIDQIRRMLADHEGRWLLEAPGSCEVAVSADEDGVVRHYVIDRTIGEHDAPTWVVDYKTGRPDRNDHVDTYISREAAHHTTQLRRYVRTITAMTGSRPRAAIYFTALARLVEIDHVS